MDKKELGKNLQLFRQQKGISQDELAKDVGISTGLIQQYERGEKTPKLDVFIKIANYLSVSADDLLGDQIQNRYIVKESPMLKNISQLPFNEQDKIHQVIEVLIRNFDELN